MSRARCTSATRTSTAESCGRIPHQTDVRAAELMLAQARTDVAMKRRFTPLSFESVKFIDLFNDWWKNHGSRTRSKFEYRTPRVSPDSRRREPARSLRTESELPGGSTRGRPRRIEHQPVPDDPLQRLQLCYSLREIRQEPGERRPAGEGTSRPGPISGTRRNRCDDPRLRREWRPGAQGVSDSRAHHRDAEGRNPEPQMERHRSRFR